MNKRYWTDPYIVLAGRLYAPIKRAVVDGGRFPVDQGPVKRLGTGRERAAAAQAPTTEPGLPLPLETEAPFVSGRPGYTRAPW